MRIVAGKHRGRKLQAPAGSATRPTSDRAREALFNILDHGRFAAAGSPLAGQIVLDCFAGTGALGLEALSRGAAHVTFLENAGPALAVLGQNIRDLGEQSQTTMLRIDATKPPRAARAAGLAFFDPPYGQDLVPPALTALAGQGWLAADALIIAEIAARESLTPPPGFALEDDRRYGAARLIFLRYGTDGV